jgi:hypothetical protein
MVDFLQIAAAAAGFGPAMALMYYTLRNYTFPTVEKPYFDDRKLFAFFALGVVLGMVIFAFENWVATIAVPETLLAIILGLAAMEELMKLVILNFPRFQRKIDTGFYGLSMGLGISSTFTFATVYVFLLDATNPEALEIVAACILGLMFVLLHGSTTALIGIGVARGDTKGYFAEAFLVHVIFSLFYESFFIIELIQPPFNLIGLGAAAGVVAYEYQKVHRISFPALIRDAKRLTQKK